MSRSVIAPQYGDPTVLTTIDVTSAPLAADEVRISVRAAGVNPADWKQLAGMFGRNESALPLRPGSEVAGVVSEVGPDVTSLDVGDEVIAYRIAGGYAEEVTAAAASVFLKPPSLSFEAGAGLLLAGTTAWHLLEAVAVGADTVLVVSGATGAVGRIAVQLAIHRGASVVGTGLATRLHEVEALGAVAVAYGEGLLDRLRSTLPNGADAAIDTAGTTEGLDGCVAITGDAQRVATVAGYPRAAELGVQILARYPGGDPGTELRNAAREPIIRLAGEGVVSVEVSRRFGLDEAADALALSKSGGAGGKLVLIP